MNWNTVNAQSLRQKTETTIENKPGIYKWWAKKTDLDTILDALEIKFNSDELKYIENENEWYCIYVGQAKSLENRIQDTHVNGRNKSTLRKSIGAILRKKHGNQDLEEEINNFIDKLAIKYRQVNSANLDQEEAKEIGHDFLRIFNSQHNPNKLRSIYKITTKLSELRKKIK